MRTTLTLEDDLAARLHERARREKTSFEQAVNDAIRRGLLPPDRIREEQPGYRVRTFESALQPGVAPLRLNQLA